VIDADRNNPNVKWISLADAKRIVSNGIPTWKIHNIDFIYFDKPGNDFVLTRIDADNNFNVDGGIVGVTFIVFTSYSLRVYSNLFRAIFNNATQTFAELIQSIDPGLSL